MQEAHQLKPNSTRLQQKRQVLKNNLNSELFIDRPVNPGRFFLLAAELS
jgi:hypothetical protein